MNKKKIKPAWNLHSTLSVYKSYFKREVAITGDFEKNQTQKITR